ncbi:MAG: CPBP family intramembrane metalloprotease [Phycisphaeraceae bacterium]|nr:CPBP family intramembrane metalloprotease [Phycisphaeraceae bacterium]
MERHPAHPRLVPFVLYVALLFVVVLAREQHPLTYPVLYAIKIALVSWVVWRYRKLMPEITLSFHWLAIPAAVICTAGWIGLAWLMAGEFGIRMEAVMAGEPLGAIDYAAEDVTAGIFAITSTNFFVGFLESHPAAAWISLGMRLLGMTILVAIIEEVLYRSLLLRSLSRWRDTRIALLQFLGDMPIIGDMILHRKAVIEAAKEDHVLKRAFERVPLGHVTFFGVLIGAVLWSALSHLPRDWPGTFLCAFVFAWVLVKTREKGLGPVIWAHGLTNALLWGYVIATGDWQFL